MHRASLNEGVAAGMLKLAGFGAGGFRAAKKSAQFGEAEASTQRSSGRRDESHSVDGSGATGGTADDRTTSTAKRATAERSLTSAGGEMTSEGLEGDERRMGSHAEAGASGRGGADVARGGADVAQVLLDPMCGSGTLLIEAALMATNRAPGLLRRRWPFEVRTRR